MEIVNALVDSKALHPILSVLRGGRNGVLYGIKIRAPHALVMTLLFGRASVKVMATRITKATYTHARNLGTFVFIYKGLTAALAALQGGEKSVHAFAAAFAGGYYVFGANNAINMQINLYLLSRITVGLIRLAAQKGVLPTSQTQETVFPWFGALVWGVVLWLFEHHRGVLQASLGTSMQYLYKDSGAWRGAKDFLIGALP